MAQKLASAIGSAVSQGLAIGIWIAAGELPPAKRRAARAGIGAAFATVGWFTSARSDREVEWVVGDGLTVREHKDEEPRRVDRKRLALMIATGAMSVGATAGRRRLEKRWLAKLIRDGHPHPHRALGVRMGVVSAGVALASRLTKPY
jgi:hypothetical protein